MAWFSLCKRYKVKIKNMRGVNMGLIYVDEEYLKVVNYLINEKEREVEKLTDKIKKAVTGGARAVKAIQLGPVVIDPSSIKGREVPDKLWTTRAAEECLESRDLKNSLNEAVSGILNQRISNYDVLSITCDKGIKAWGSTYDRNGDKRHSLKDASLLYFYEQDEFLFLNDFCIRAKLMSFEQDTRLFFRCYFRKKEIKNHFQKNPQSKVTVFGIVYDDLEKYLLKQVSDAPQEAKKSLLVVAASDDIIRGIPMDAINRPTFLSQ